MWSRAEAVLEPPPRPLTTESRERGLKMGKAIVVDVGERFHRWTVTDSEPVYGVSPTGNRFRRYACRCDCGTERTVLLSSLRNGASKSCGCLSLEVFYSLITKHGHRHEGIYHCWSNMKHRTSAKNIRRAYKNVSRDPRWDDFTTFYADMAPTYFKGAQLSRYGDVGGYTPTNCRWLTPEEDAAERLEILRLRRETRSHDTSSLR